MIGLPKSVVSLSAVVTAAGLLTLAVPRAAHAVAAALVQVTNTSSNPVITQSTPSMASQMIELYGQSGCNFDGNTAYPFEPLRQGGDLAGGSYSVPANQSLVITAVDVTYSPCEAYTGAPSPSIASLTLNGNTLPHRSWIVPGATTGHFNYPSGFALAGGSAVGLTNLSQYNMALEMHLAGYLTSN